MTSHRHRVLLLKTGVQYGRRGVFFARARLYPDRIEFSAWNHRGSVNRLIDLADLDHVEWTTTAADANAILVLAEGERIPVRFEQVRRWHHALEQRLLFAEPGAHPPLNLPLRELVAYTTSMS